LGFTDCGTEDMPALEELGLAFVPIARVKQLLHIVNMVVTGRHDAPKLSAGGMVLLRQVLGCVTPVQFQHMPRTSVEVLHGAGTYHKKEACILQSQSLAFTVTFPPSLILFKEDAGVYDVVVVIDSLEKVLNESIWRPVS
jgi:hypothetical protein